ncbi:MAG: pilus assembly protein N-terminal domain-containing protein, partial [Planctomycetota bacterium]
MILLPCSTNTVICLHTGKSGMTTQMAMFRQVLAALILTSCVVSISTAQTPPSPKFEVTQDVDTLVLTAGSNKRLKFGYNIPELFVENPEIISASPISENEILVTGVKPGITNLTILDENDNLQVLMVEVAVDVRELENALSNHFPDSQIKVSALKTSVLLKGNVARADQVQNIVAVAKDFFPANVINELKVNGTQNIAIKVKIYEVSRSKFRELGVDWSFFGSDFNIVSSVSDLIQTASATAVTAADDTLSLGVLDNANRFNAIIRFLETQSVAKLLDQPILVSLNGRPSEFLSGGEVPIQVASGLGTNSVEFRPFGTKLDIVPIVHGQGELTLEVRAEVSEIANDLANSTGVPGFRVRRVNTGVHMKAGHTLALAGDYREDTQATKRGLPKLMHHPIFGQPFRRVLEESNEVELVFLITPRFISEVDPSMVPSGGPGTLTTNPSDYDLFQNGHLEVPKCNDDCPQNDRFDQLGQPVIQPGMNNHFGQNQVVPGNGGFAPQQVIPASQPVPQKTGFFKGIGNALAPKTAKKTQYRFPWQSKKVEETAGQPAARQADAGNSGFAWPS